jgi:hypothetical protein
MKHEIIYTDDYALIVSDEEMKKGDFNVPSDFDRTSDISITSEEDLEIINDRFNGYKKVVAHLPLNGAFPINELPLLPEFSQGEDVAKIAFNELFPVWDSKDTLENLEQSQIKAFELGYNKVKETHEYTEKDLIKAFKAGHSGAFVKEHIVPHYDEYIQSLQQSKRPKSILLKKIENNICIGEYNYE